MAFREDPDVDAEWPPKRIIPRAIVDMNITPMIDVLLVLLVIFMSTLPLSQRGLDVNLPAETRQPPKQEDSRQIVLNYTADKTISINGKEVSPSDLEEQLRTTFQDRQDQTLFVVGAATLHYGDIVAVMDAAKGAGVQKISLVTEGMRRTAASGGK